MNSAGSGNCALLPEILGQEAGAASLVMQARVPCDLLYLRGHFDGTPVVAGVVQLAWVQHYARSQFQLPGGIYRLEQLKFQRLLRPPESFTLNIDLQREKSLVAFRLYHGERIFSSGRILFGPPLK